MSFMGGLSLSNNRLERGNERENKHRQIDDIIALRRNAAPQNRASCFNSRQFIKHQGEAHAEEGGSYTQMPVVAVAFAVFIVFSIFDQRKFRK